LNKFRKMML